MVGIAFPVRNTLATVQAIAMQTLKGADSSDLTRNRRPIAAPAEPGFGWRVIEQGLAHEIGGPVELDFGPDGLCATG